MGWVYLDDKFPEHDKIIAAGGDAVLLWVLGLAYCNRRYTEGRIPKNYVPQLSDRRKPMTLAAKLVEVGLWYEDKDAYVVHDYEKWNKSATAKAKAKKAANTRWGHAQADAQASSEHEPEDVPDAMLGDAIRAGTRAARPPGTPPPLLPSVVTSVDSSSSTSCDAGEEDEDWPTVIAKRRLQRRQAERGPVTNPPQWLRQTASQVAVDYADQAAKAQAEGPIAGRDLADLLEPDASKRSLESRLTGLAGGAA